MYFEIGLHPFSGFSMDVLNIFFGLQNDPLTKRNNFKTKKKNTIKNHILPNLQIKVSYWNFRKIRKHIQ